MSYNGSSFNRYRQNRPKVDASSFDSALSHTRRSDASEKKEEKFSRPFLHAFACGQVSSPDLYRLKESAKIFETFPYSVSDTDSYERSGDEDKITPKQTYRTKSKGHHY